MPRLLERQTLATAEIPRILGIAEIGNELFRYTLRVGSMPGANKMLLRFWKSQDGNYAAIFAIAMLPIMSGVAGVVDYVGTSTSASKLQESLDATGLAIATKYHSGMTDQEVDQFGSDFFAANIRRAGIVFNEPIRR